MRERSRILPLAAGFVVAGLLGAGLALGGVAAFDIGVTRETVREVSPVERSRSPSSFQAGKPLSINQIYERSAPGVVQVTSTAAVEEQSFDPFAPFDPFSFPQQQRRQALGSGFVIDKAGYIVTNYHVVEDAEDVEVSFSNNSSMKARVVGVDPSTDIALLKVDANSRALKPLALGDSDAVKVGDAVVAIGNPFGLERSITAGIVSALQRQITAPNQFAIDKVIQTDAPINRGNSGGPLLNAAGEVIGVNSQIETGGTGAAGNVGIGFAVPINTVKDVVAQLKSEGKVDRAFLGIEGLPITPALARLVKLPTSRGVLVQSVREGSGADDAGLRGGSTDVVIAGESYRLGGDVIVKADGVSVSSLEQLRDVLTKKKPGDTIEIEIYRGDEKMTLDVKLGRQPPSPQG